MPDCKIIPSIPYHNYARIVKPHTVAMYPSISFVLHTTLSTEDGQLEYEPTLGGYVCYLKPTIDHVEKCGALADVVEMWAVINDREVMI